MLPQHLLVERKHQHVVDVEPFAGVRQHADEVAQIGRLVAVEKVFLQVERFKNKVRVFLVQGMLAEEWVVAYRDVGLRRTQHSELVHPAGCLYGWKKIGEKLLVSLPVEDQHRNPVPVFGRPDEAEKVLRDDVLKKSGLARTSGPEHDRLHHTCRIGPEPGLAVNVIAEYDRALFIGVLDGFPVFGLAYK